MDRRTARTRDQRYKDTPSRLDESRSRAREDMAVPAVLIRPGSPNKEPRTSSEPRGTLCLVSEARPTTMVVKAHARPPRRRRPRDPGFRSEQNLNALHCFPGSSGRGPRSSPGLPVREPRDSFRGRLLVSRRRCWPSLVANPIARVVVVLRWKRSSAIWVIGVESGGMTAGSMLRKPVRSVGRTGSRRLEQFGRARHSAAVRGAPCPMLQPDTA